MAGNEKPTITFKGPADMHKVHRVPNEPSVEAGKQKFTVTEVQKLDISDFEFN